MDLRCHVLGEEAGNYVDGILLAQMNQRPLCVSVSCAFIRCKIQLPLLHSGDSPAVTELDLDYSRYLLLFMTRPLFLPS